jgi:hypothetical protein
MTLMVRAVLLVTFVVGLVTVGGSHSEVAGQQLISPAPDPVASPSPGPIASPGASAGHSLAEQEVFGFLPYWELGNADGIDLETLTTLAWFGLEAGWDGRLVRETTDGEATPGWAGWTSEAFRELQARAEDAGVRVVLTVERFAWDEAGRKETKALLVDPMARAALVEDIVDTITLYDADGVNLDFEPLPQTVRKQYLRLVRELRAGLDAVDPSLQLTFDLTAGVSSYPLKRLTADGAADAAVLMGYEYRSSGSKIAGSVAPLRDPDDLDLRDSVKRALARTPADRLILALPWYGRAWSTRTDDVGAKTRRGDRYIAPSTALYRSALARAAVAGRRYDRTQASAWSVYPSRACDACPPSPRQLWYDDVDSVRAKVGLALRKGLRGVGIWALGYEGARPDLWSALRYALERPVDASPPIGTANIAPESIIGTQDGMAFVGQTVRLDLSTSDGVAGSGVAFVRVATSGHLTDRGVLRAGTTFPAVESITITMPGATPIDEVFIPGGAPAPTPSTQASAFVVPDPNADLGTIRVQWRDIAGNWSEPIKLRVQYQSSPAISAKTSP